MSAGLETFFALLTDKIRSAFRPPRHERRFFRPKNRIATGQQSSREDDSIKQLGSQQIQQLVDAVKYFDKAGKMTKSLYS